MSLNLFIVAAAIAAGHAVEARVAAEIEPDIIDIGGGGTGGGGGGGQYSGWFESSKYQAQTAGVKLQQLMEMCPTGK